MIETAYFSWEDHAKALVGVNRIGDLSDHRYIFSSRDWLQAWMKVYQPEENVRIGNREQGYVVLTRAGRSWTFAGNPFNDFNGFHPTGRVNPELFEAVMDLAKAGDAVRLERLHETTAIGFFTQARSAREQEPGIFIRSGELNFFQQISLKIRKQHRKSNCYFQRVSPLERGFSEGLEWLLHQREEKLHARHADHHNPSFLPDFARFIRELAFQPGMGQHLFLDLCSDEEGYKAASMHFKLGRSTLNYLRTHAPGGTKWSYGLILDVQTALWNDAMGIQVHDLSRGEEAYKFRLGGQLYRLTNLIYG